MRIGHGYDVHRLAAGESLVLCGVPIAFHLGTVGHSDADVALHALMDAMLGALALGDIGRYFPDTDPAYRGISSLKLLESVRERCAQAGYVLANADITILAQQPKLAPHIPQMRAVTARALGVEVGQISVKATTEERLGFTGAMEGIAAHAVVLLEPRG